MKRYRVCWAEMKAMAAQDSDRIINIKNNELLKDRHKAKLKNKNKKQ